MAPMMLAVASRALVLALLPTAVRGSGSGSGSDSSSSSGSGSGSGSTGSGSGSVSGSGSGVQQPLVAPAPAPPAPPNLPAWDWDRLHTFCFPGCDPSDNPTRCPSGFSPSEVADYGKFDLVLVQGQNYTTFANVSADALLSAASALCIVIY
jgi:hypothetical protein